MKVLHKDLTGTISERKQALLSSLQERFVVTYRQYSCLQMLSICLQPLVSCSNLKWEWDYRHCLQPLLLDWHLPTVPEASLSSLSEVLNYLCILCSDYRYLTLGFESRVLKGSFHSYSLLY